MPRPRKTPGQLAPKNSVRSRKWSIVIHDVTEDKKELLRREMDTLKPDYYLIALEPYKEGQEYVNPYHIHLFLQYPQPKAKSTVLNYIQKLNYGGRVQADPGKGSFEACKKYITDPKKNKIVDTNIIENVDTRKLPLIERYPDQVSVCIRCSKKYFDPTLQPGECMILRIGQSSPKICLRCQDKKNLQDRLPQKPQDA